MDLRDIQRLHAQFAPDMTTIDLPRQIAALPAPANMVGNDVAPAMRRRWDQTGPIVRGSVLAVAAAAVVGMAGMGAASLYRTLNTSQRPTPIPTTVLANTQATQPVNTPTSKADKLKDDDAAPAQPVMNTPGLNSSDLAGASSLGLTADQFRRSLKTSGSPTQGASSSPAPAQMTADSERAAVSPIHRSAPRSSVAPTVAPTPIPAATVSAAAPALSPASVAAAKPVDPVVAQQVPQQSVIVAPVAPSQPLPVVAAVSAAATTKQTHPARHRVSKPRVEQNSAVEANVPVRAVTPSAPTSRTGSNEVQMF